MKDMTLRDSRWFRRALAVPLCLVLNVATVSSMTADVPGTVLPAGPMHIARQEHTATLLRSGEVLVAGGMDCTASCRILASAELYNPRTRKWRSTGTMHTARRDHTATLLPNGQVLVTGGYGGGCPPCRTLASAELYDPHTGGWRQTGHMVGARFSHIATLLPTGKVLVLGGRNCAQSACTSVSSAEVYLPRTGKWAATRHLPEQGCGGTATLLHQGWIFVTCDNGSGETYDPRTGQWKATVGMSTARTGPTVALLHNGQVLVAGGCCGPSGVLASSDLYDPRTGQWKVTGSMSTARSGPTAVLLRNGQVLVTGGGDSRSGVLSSAELYNPRTGTWRPTGGMTTPRQANTLTLLGNGQVLATGGFSGGCPPCKSLSSAELYNPRTGKWGATGSMTATASVK